MLLSVFQPIQLPNGARQIRTSTIWKPAILQDLPVPFAVFEGEIEQTAPQFQPPIAQKTHQPRGLWGHGFASNFLHSYAGECIVGFFEISGSRLMLALSDQTKINIDRRDLHLNSSFLPQRVNILGFDLSLSIFAGVFTQFFVIYRPAP